MYILSHKIKWESTDKIAFREFVENKEEVYLIAKRKKEKHRVQVGTLLINGGALGSFSIKEILIGLSFRRVGLVGISEEKMRVKCPHCTTIQQLKEEWQKCCNCGKKFYLFDDNW